VIAVETPDVIETLAATPIWLRAGFDHLSEAAARRAPRPHEWSALDILAHLRASDAILAPRIMQVLCRPDAPLAGYDERIWARLAARAHLPLAAQLAAFEAHRAELVGLLRTLTSAEWALAGQHEVRGQLTVRDIAADLAQHEQEHQAQFQALLSDSESLHSLAHPLHSGPCASDQSSPHA
jgi:hypothetical protein